MMNAETKKAGDGMLDPFLGLLEPDHRSGRHDLELGLRGWQCAPPAARERWKGKTS